MAEPLEIPLVTLGLHTLYPPDGSSIKPTLDIVAVHGLGGNAYSTWRHSSGNLWLQELSKSSKLRSTRILTFGYHATAFIRPFSKSSTGRTFTFAEILLNDLSDARSSRTEKFRPIIFIGHSLGGIVIKTALTHAHSRTTLFGNILDSTKAILFFGTPHQGADVAAWTGFLDKLTTILGIKSTEVTKELKTWSTPLLELSTEFSELAPRFNLTTFFEQRSYHGVTVVHEGSARMGQQSERVIGLDADHRDICKFESTGDSNYKRVLKRLEAVATEIEEQTSIEARESAVPRPSLEIPFLRDPKFIGREDIIQEIESGFTSNSRIALVGLGGVGKSQIAIEYSYRLKEKSPDIWIFWVHGSSQSRFSQSYQAIANTVELHGRDDPKRDVNRLVYEWLKSERSGRWLMILDNADDIDVFYDPKANEDVSSLQDEEHQLLDYIPQCLNGLVLITSRDRAAAFALAGEEDRLISVSPMAEKDARDLLRKRLPRDTSSEDSFCGLVETLEFLPLAIVQASAYIIVNGPRMTVSRYLDLFHSNKNNQSRLLKRGFADHRRDQDAKNAVLITWQISFEQIKKDNACAADLLSFMSFLNNQGIPMTLLSEYNQDALELEDALGKLAAFSLVMAEKNGETYEMHQLVQLATREWLRSQGKQHKPVSEVTKVLSKLFPFPDFEEWQSCATLLPHVQAIFQEGQDLQENTQARLGLLGNVASYFHERGQYNLAASLGTEHLALSAERLGPEHLGTLVSLDNLANTLSTQGRYQEAEKIHRQVLVAREKQLGPEHPHTLGSLNNLATVLSGQGRYPEAEKIHRQALVAREKQLGPEHPDTLGSLNNLATVLSRQGRHQEAEKIHRQVLVAWDKQLGPEHPDTLGSLNNLATVLSRQGNYPEAEKIHRQVLVAREKQLGPEHPDTLNSLNHLANTLSTQGRYQEAEKINRQVLVAREKQLGPEHPYTLHSLNNLATVLSGQGNYPEAEKIHRQVLVAREKQLGPEHPDTLHSRNNLARTQQAQSRYEEAEPIYREH
ncbi:MAG: hypothetical protein M1816_001711 [Peltula sp. TS41687]|nr:MAG: hypothetical protein M1816_001711 [Peltula sp. TS41687]